MYICFISVIDWFLGFKFKQRRKGYDNFTYPPGVHVHAPVEIWMRSWITKVVPTWTKNQNPGSVGVYKYHKSSCNMNEESKSRQRGCIQYRWTHFTVNITKVIQRFDVLNPIRTDETNSWQHIYTFFLQFYLFVIIVHLHYTTVKLERSASSITLILKFVCGNDFPVCYFDRSWSWSLSTQALSLTRYCVCYTDIWRNFIKYANALTIKYQSEP